MGKNQAHKAMQGSRAGSSSAEPEEIEDGMLQPDKVKRQMIPSDGKLSVDMEVDYESNEKASIVYTALAMDKELQPDKVKRQMILSDGKLSVHFEAVEARFLRASFNAFVDVLTLATKTIEAFSPEIRI